MIRIRMYNVGFGDCILITVDQPNGPWRMLVDCGVHPAGPSSHSIAAIVEAVIADVTDQGAAHLNLVVATHRHRDHVSGFANPRWAAVNVDEVWLPWTEDPGDSVATALRSAQEAAASGIKAALAAAALPHELAAAAANSLTNEDAMATLQSGFAGTPTRKYLPADGTLPATASVTSLTAGQIHILGPSHDPAVLRHMDPPGSESYRSFVPSFADADGVLAATRPAPFLPAFSLTQTQYEEQHSALLATLPSNVRGTIINASSSGGEDALAAIADLDNAINNTSLILALTAGDHAVLLPGDAQWGPWQAILADADATALVGRTTFYKVSHHGSYNGTPKSLVAKLADHITAGISVHNVPQWRKIPEKALVHQLETQMTVLRTDQPVPAEADISQAPDGMWIEIALD